MEDIQYRLVIDGDKLEQRYWHLFIRDYFPSYESFWLKYIVPLTNRPGNINFKSDKDILKMGKSLNDLNVAQLAYSSIVNVGRCFDIVQILKGKSIDINIEDKRNFFIEGFSRLATAQDNIFELLSRKINHSYIGFDISHSKMAKKKWCKDKNIRSLIHIRRYRNFLVHGVLNPSFYDPNNNKIWFPKIGTESKYLDWRTITDEIEKEKSKNDFISPETILEESFQKTVSYFEDYFKNL